MRVLDLFSGIGGFSLGLECAGMRTAAFCEIEPYCRAVLRKHWPTVPIFEDIRTLRASDVGPVDVVCGGFPCQDISLAGKGAGLEGERSGLWWEMHRVISEVRPRYAIIENVSALRSRGLDAVLGSLAEIGYDAEWHCIPASAVGAPHRRDRVWIIAYASSERGRATAAGHGVPAQSAQLQQVDGQACSDNNSPLCRDVAYSARLQPGRQEQRAIGERAGAGGQSVLCDTWWDQTERLGSSLRPLSQSDWWLVEPDVGRVAHGVPRRVDRLRALGNAVVPQIPEIIGRAIMQAEGLAW